MKHPLFCSNVEHIAYVDAKNLKQGYAYRYSCTVDAQTYLPQRPTFTETSNCYIVNTSSTDSDGYYFPANQAGNGRAVDWAGIGFNDDANECYPHNSGSLASGGNDGVRFSGNGVAVTLNENSCVSDVFYSSNRIYFKASGAKGNAKITLTNDGVKVWTWHIWCVPEPGETMVGSYKVLNLNLGAITKVVDLKYDNEAPEATGFYYTFGSPIGYTINEYSYGFEGGQMWTMKEAFQHPNQPYLRDKDGLYMPFNPYAASNRYQVWARIWGGGGSKTCYDPCPPGYKVTPKAFWDSFSPAHSDYYGVYSQSGGGGAFFTWNGRAYAGSYSDGSTTIRGIETESIYLSNAGGYVNTFTRNMQVYLWTSSSNGADKAYHYRVKKKQSNGGAIDGSGVFEDILTRGMGVRCVYEW